MKIGVLGTGMVGNAIASKLVALGHEVMMGSRTSDNAKARTWAKTAGARGRVGTFSETRLSGRSSSTAHTAQALLQRCKRPAQRTSTAKSSLTWPIC